MMRSLQTRLLIGLTAGIAVVLVLSGVLLLKMIRAELYREFDLTLADEARALAAQVEREEGRIQTEIGEHSQAGTQPIRYGLFYVVWNTDGKLIERSRGLEGVTLTSFGGTLEHPEFQSLTLPNDVAGRMVGMRFTPYQSTNEDSFEFIPDRADEAKSQVTLVLARDTVGLRASLTRITWLLTGVLGGSILAMILLTWPIVRESLRPLQKITEQIKALGSDALDQELDATQAPTEVRAVVDCLNELLTRLHEAFQRERAFSANVAHELRTPLAGLHTTIDVALAKRIDSTDDRRALRQCLTICKQAETLTENLLLLARLDANQFPQRLDTVLLNTLLVSVQ